MMIVPFILTALQPLCPALFLRETLRWFIASLGGWLMDEAYVAYLQESHDRGELRALMGFLVFIEDGLELLIYVRARQRLGHRSRAGRARRRRADPPVGHPRSFEDIYPRFERACLRFADVERLAQRRALKLKRLLDRAADQLEAAHHPVDSAPTAVVVASAAPIAAGLPVGAYPTAALAPAAFQSWTLGIRAPP